jgi:NAD(P) transhydrogenase subunit alpha
VILAAGALRRIVPQMMTAAGTLQPAHALVIGAGVAGLQAIATARRLGAVVKGVDTRPVVREQVESLGARFVPLEVQHEQAQDEGGYARDLGEAFYAQEQQALSPHVHEADMIITTAMIPRRRAPVLITRAMVESMKAGSAIVDLAAPAGGNCALSQPGRDVVHAGVTVMAPLNLPNDLPVHASLMIANNLAAFLDELVKDNQVKLDPDNEILAGTLITHLGQVRHAAAPGATPAEKESP